MLGQILYFTSLQKMRQPHNFQPGFGVGAVVSVLLLIVASSTAFPTRATVEEPPSNFLSSIRRNFEVVEGPKEFILPLAPLKSLLASHQGKGDGEDGTISGNVSDLDYMVYGKVYLLKALGITNSSLSRNGENIASTTNKQLLTTGDAISFSPTTKHMKRPYQYKYWNTPKPSDYKDFADGFTGSAEYRKIEVRSVEREDEPVLSTLPPGSDTAHVDTVSPSSATLTSHPENDFMDEEALELLKKIMPKALAVHETTGIPNQNPIYDVAIPGNTSTGNASLELGNRFLLNVPQKSCPEGQMRSHRGTCKLVVVHHPSPRDGIFAGRLTAPKVVTEPQNNGSELERHTGGFQLSTLFSSFVKLEKSLERAVKDAEQKLGQMMQNEGKKHEESINDEKSV